jgi:hypothetical protein
MRRILAVCALGLGLLLTPAVSMPRVVGIDAPATDNGLRVDVSTRYQRKAARRACAARYGNRLAYVTTSGSRYVCHFRKSDRQLTKQAARSCRKSGYRLSRVTSIRIKGNRSITRFVCRRY